MYPGRAFHALVCCMVLCVGLSAAGVAAAATLTVDQGDAGCNDVTGTPYCNVGPSINAATAGDVIEVGPGTYPLNQASLFKDLAIRGAGRTSTILDGGGVNQVFYVAAGKTLTVEDLTVRGGNASGTGGAFDVYGTLRVFRCDLRDNVSGSSGGAIYAFPGTTLEMVEVAVADNQAGFGGGIAALSSGIGTTTTVIDRCSFTGNSSSSVAGGVAVGGDATLRNVTISGNQSVDSGGGLEVDWDSSTVTLDHVTVTDNTSDSDGDGSGVGGGVDLIGTPTVTMRHVVIYGNSAGSSSSPDCSGTVASAGYNLVDDVTGCTITGDTTGNVVGVSAELGPLTDNGGPTPTHLPLAMSPLVDAGDPAGCLDISGAATRRDQRGAERPVDGAGGPAAVCDIGAVERGAEPPIFSDGFNGGSTNPWTAVAGGV